ncbi:FMN-dependent NADH-azoreductase [Paenibacillus yonginensis]|uniref:FMN dependent NADH:quinone oxidoreductase n=1 Tax=Paenibacillus yonginensis TaxID=1462996 RepID=A0A1B1N3B1_9BACL|nr:FMN-dependent NADH-azoreductase [Paenibacillus yonginensis]ANS75907.1 FMN-dependent NADH-azoreductase [Paenibacillus yonginensis]
MSTLLYVAAHPLTRQQSGSLSTGEVFLKAYRDFHPGDEIIELNLFETAVPPIDEVAFRAWGRLRKGTPLEQLAPEEQQAASAHARFSDQFVAADKYVFVNPMWNHFLPSQMKAYLDTLCVAGKTFRYTSQGPIGLLQNKKALHIQAAGGVYDRSSPFIKDFGHAYLAHIMDFFGIQELQSLFIEGRDARPDQAAAILADAHEQAVQLARHF